MRQRLKQKRMFTGVLPAAAALLVVLACGGGDGAAGSASAPSQQVAAGKARFQRTCATCHGPEAEGVPNLGKNLHGNEFVRSNSDADLVEFLKVGRPAWDPANTRGVDMPPRGGDPTLTEKDMADIVTYLRTIQ